MALSKSTNSLIHTTTYKFEVFRDLISKGIAGRITHEISPLIPVKAHG